MRLLSWLLCAAAAIVPAITSEDKGISRPKRDSSDKKIVCYYTNWSVYRPGTAKFTPQNINPYLCTHLIYAFGGLSKDNALKPFDKYQDIEQGGYAKFNGLKTYNKNLKTMLAIGGWNEGSARFSPLVADAERRKELVKNTVKFLRQNHFDGLDLDWEYPSFRDGGKPRDRDNYATLVQEFMEEFERESEKTGRTRLLLTMAVPAGIEYIDKGYDIPKLNKYLDWMNILSYDYHSAFEPAINHHSPLFSLEEDDEYNFDAALNIDHTIQHYVKLGADKNKLVLGIPTYGRSYTLFNPDATNIGSPADGPGEQGESTREKGYLAYYEICERVSSGGWTLENPNPEAMGPYAYKGNQWVGFDDEDIVRMKAKYVNDNDLGGIMFWSIDNDDFRGKCHGKPYPLIEAAKEALLANANELVPSVRSASSRASSKKQDQETSSKSKARKTRLRTKPSSTTESSQSKSSGRTSTTPQPPTTPDPGSDFVCKDEGFYPHPRDCKKYFWCLDSGPSSLGIVAHQFTCPSGLVFNKISDSCDYARNVICKTKPEPTTTTTTTTSTTTTTARTTTARNRLVITASPPRTTSTTTTTEEPDDEEEPEEDEEDPGTIKELINLIKKLGGVEQLEKQLNLQNSDGKEKIKPSLYSRVLQGRTANRYRGINSETSTTKYVSAFRNRPAGFQSPSTEETATSTRGSEKPRYVTIQRNRSTKKPAKADEEIKEEEEVEEEIEEQPKQSIQETPRSFRRRPTIDTTTEREYVVLRRSRPPKEDISTPKYKNLVRIRSTTEAAAEKEEEDPPEEEEEEEEAEAEAEAEAEVVEEEEEETEEIEPVQKLKKYSSIIRDKKKIVAEEEESKVSGPQGLQHENGISPSSTVSILDERDNVNNVNTSTSPRYVEIRRTQSTTTEPTEINVNSVNNSHDNHPENIDETNEVHESQSEGIENSIRRITTEIFKRPTRPSFRTSTLVSTTPITFETNINNIKIPRFREKQSPTSTEESPIFSIRPISQYKSLNKNIPENQVSENRNEEDRFPKQEEPFKNFKTSDTLPVTEAPRRFKFALRKKPAILSLKSPESTTEVFQITVPNTPSLVYTEKNLRQLPFASATLEPTTPNVDSTNLGTSEDGILVTFEKNKDSLSTNQLIPTTSTQTSVVTSITESSFTERKRIFVPKKTRLKSEFESKFITNPFTTENPFETTRPVYRASLSKKTTTGTTSKAETTTGTRKNRFKIASTTSTTTEEPTVAKKYVPKKARTFKRISSTETPEITSSTTERFKFQQRNYFNRQIESDRLEPSNSLQLRFSTARRKRIFSKKEEDDLEVQQTATFFDDDFDSRDSYILGGALKQTSEKDYLNADVFFRAIPTVEEENLAEKTDEELKNSLNKVAVTPDKAVTVEKKEIARNKFLTANLALRNLRTRTRQPVENVSEKETVEAKTPLPTSRNRGNIRSNFLTSNPNFKTFRSRIQQNDISRNVNTTKKDASTVISENSEIGSVQNIKERKLRPSNGYKLFGNNESINTTKEENSVSGAVFGTKTPSTQAIGILNSNAPNFRNFRTRSRQNQVNEKFTPNVESSFTHEVNADEVLKNEIFPRFETIRKPTGNSNNFISDGDIQNLKSNGIKNQLFTENFTVKGTEVTSVNVSVLPTYSIYSTSYSSQRTTKKGITDEAVTAKPLSISQNAKERNLNNFTAITTSNTPILDPTNSTTIGPTFGTKIEFSVGSTSPVIASTVSPSIQTAGVIRGTFITVAPKVASPKSKETPRTNLKAEKNDGVTQPSSQTEFRSNTEEYTVNNAANLNPSNFKSFRTRTRQNLNSSSGLVENTQKPLEKNNSVSNPNRLTRTRGKVKAIDSIFQATENGSINETVTKSRPVRIGFFKNGRRVLVRRPPESSPPEIKEEENELELPEEPLSSISKTVSDKRKTQDYQNRGNRIRSTTQSTVTSDRTERKRTQFDRRRLRGESKSTTFKPEVQTETSSSSSRANILLRRKSRPIAAVTTTTEEPYVEQQEDSRLEESKSLDETPGIQDLADPAVVAIHNLATVSPGPFVSAVTSSLNSYSQTPATYTVHVSPSDIASFSTPTNIASTPGSVSSRPTSILTLKPYTVPLITRQYVTKQTPTPFRSTSLLAEAEIPIVTKEPYNPRSEILIQSRKQETTQKTKPTTFITPASQKEAAPKPRRLKPFSKVPKQEVAQSGSSSESPVDYEYYDDDEDPLANIPASALKVKVHSDGYIECLDRGNFPHPFSCKKFISCAKMENNELLGWEYTCPKHLSFDPVGGICNWSAGLGCQH